MANVVMRFCRSHHERRRLQFVTGYMSSGQRQRKPTMTTTTRTIRSVGHALKSHADVSENREVA